MKCGLTGGGGHKEARERPWTEALTLGMLSRSLELKEVDCVSLSL